MNEAIRIKLKSAGKKTAFNFDLKIKSDQVGGSEPSFRLPKNKKKKRH